MDLWVVAAATGAGYLTKYWQKLSRDKDKDSLLQFSLGDASLEKSETPSCPFSGHEDRKPVSGDRFSDRNQWGSVSGTEVASTSGWCDGENVGSLGYQYSNVLSLSNIPPVYPADRNEHGDESRQSNDLDDNHGGERGTFRVPLSNKSSLRAERSYGLIVKPQNSLESCLMAQLYKEHAETIVPPSPSTPRIRPLIVSDGSRIISRANGDYLCAQIGVEPNKLHKKDHLETRENTSGIPPLPKRGYKDLPKKMKVKGEKEWAGRSSSSRGIPSGKHLHLEGSPDGVVLLCLGISIGVISSFVANKKEVDKLEEVLKQTKSLVEDLQEELEMKDSVTLKEISNQNYGSQDTCDNSVSNRDLNPFSPAQNVELYDGRDSYEQKAESSESMSKIEAELEAELERLGLNMNTSTLGRRLTVLDELDPDLTADFAEGELRADMVRGHTVAQPKSNENISSASTADHCGNYAVSPRELSLRLHEVIQSRLEERIQELEEAHQSSRKNITEPENKCIMESENKQMMESENKRIMEPENKDCSSDLFNGHSAVEESINSKEEGQTIIEPLVLNLTGEALDAYNEAYAELMKLSESEGEDSPCQVFETFRDQIPKQSYGVDGSVGRFSFEEEKWLGDDHSSRVECSNHISVSDEEKSDSDGELEKQLIKQIVEKTKKGSVVLNAQKWLFIDE